MEENNKKAIQLMKFLSFVINQFPETKTTFKAVGFNTSEQFIIRDGDGQIINEEFCDN